MLTKAEPDWSEEEKKVYKQYEKKTKALSEEKEKYKQVKALSKNQEFFFWP